MAVIKVTSASFEELKSCGKTVLLDFYADWCGPCRMVAPTVAEIADEHPEYAVGKINVDEEETLALQFGIVSIPTLIVLKDGVVVDKAVGVQSKSHLLSMLSGR